MHYSQHEIEKYLEPMFSKPGYFLEIGCWDGELISQTAWLEREKGWKGLCVDPFPRNFEKRTCQVCKMAVSVDGLQRKFIKVSIDRRYGGDVSYFSGFMENIQAHWPLISEYCNYETIMIPTITPEWLYKVYRLPEYIEFLSVDVEGAEFEVFQGLNLAKHKFGLIVFEHNEDEDKKRKIGELLKGHGYTLVDSLRCDDIYKGEVR